jgi:hypothetical protein
MKRSITLAAPTKTQCGLLWFASGMWQWSSKKVVYLCNCLGLVWCFGRKKSKCPWCSTLFSYDVLAPLPLFSNEKMLTSRNCLSRWNFYRVMWVCKHYYGTPIMKLLIKNILNGFKNKCSSLVGQQWFGCKIGPSMMLRNYWGYTKNENKREVLNH